MVDKTREKNLLEIKKQVQTVSNFNVNVVNVLENQNIKIHVFVTLIRAKVKKFHQMETYNTCIKTSKFVLLLSRCL